MNIIFVRHGKTSNHELNKRQSPDSVLGEIGKQQARLVAKHLKKKLSNKEYEHILTSSYSRALETSKIIAKEVDLEVLENELIHEILSNPTLHNLAFDSELNLRFMEEVEELGGSIDWKFDNGGESIREVIIRANKFKNHILSKYKDKNVLVVSHGIFIRTFLTLVMLGDDYDDKSFKRVFDTIMLENTSLTHLEYNGSKDVWYVYSVNSTGHLK